MSSTPLMLSSNGWMTDSMMVCGSAPVYEVEILTVGGAMSGYCSTGRVLIEM